MPGRHHSIQILCGSFIASFPSEFVPESGVSRGLTDFIEWSSTWNSIFGRRPPASLLANLIAERFAKNHGGSTPVGAHPPPELTKEPVTLAVLTRPGDQGGDRWALRVLDNNGWVTQVKFGV